MRWLADRRNLATVAATLVAGVLMALLVVTVIGALRARGDAVEALEDTVAAQLDVRRAATRRIDLLQERIGELTDTLERQVSGVGEMQAQIEALQEQIEQMGGQPVVPRERRSGTEPDDEGDDERDPSPEPTDRPRRPSPPPSPTPSPTPTPTPPDDGVCLPFTDICTGGLT